MAQPECGMWVDEDDDASLRRENANSGDWCASLTLALLLLLLLCCVSSKHELWRSLFEAAPVGQIRRSFPCRCLATIYCQSSAIGAFLFPPLFFHSAFPLTFFFRWLKVRDGQNEHVADKEGAQSGSSCVVCVALCLQSRECNARSYPYRSPLDAASIKAEHKMASKALPAKLNTKKNAALMQFFLTLCGTWNVCLACFRC